MSAEVTTRVCVQCRKDFSFVGWRLDALCPSCRNLANIRRATKITCDRCGKLKPPSLATAPSLADDLCGKCALEDLLKSVAKYGSH